MITVYFDLETGGVEDYHPDIQIAAIAVDDKWNELNTFEAKIDFEVEKADPNALLINHYDAAVWHRDAIPLATMMDRFTNFINPYRILPRTSKRPPYRSYQVAQLAGHNAATFDGPRLKAMYTRAGLFLGADPRILDTLQLAMWHFHSLGKESESYRLEPLCTHFGIPVGQGEAHDALADVRLTIRLARALREAIAVQAAAA